MKSFQVEGAHGGTSVRTFRCALSLTAAARTA